ncbi:glyoxalase [Weissella viridescens]|uniref:Glyoxalase n=2 Tax=Weissella viridescens TaxID=1629 RepID=A0A3P2RD95_WEIVI|nr:glyoxalase [Weissella viridescens]RRG18729.1 glyoxalase [Weissella viridescens]
MFSSMRVMLYVDDVVAISDFWQQYAKAEVVETNSLPDGFQNIVLQVGKQTQLSLFDKKFIEKYSPEVLGNTPSLMLFSEDFETLHEAIPGALDVMENNGQQTFAFPDPEGNYFVIAKA